MAREDAVAAEERRTDAGAKAALAAANEKSEAELERRKKAYRDACRDPPDLAELKKRKLDLPDGSVFKKYEKGPPGQKVEAVRKLYGLKGGQDMTGKKSDAQWDECSQWTLETLYQDGELARKTSQK